jgi:hypothetical protein
MPALAEFRARAKQIRLDSAGLAEVVVDVQNLHDCLAVGDAVTP